MTGESVPTPHTIKPIYLISNNDGVGAKLTHVVLTGSNYAEWCHPSDACESHRQSLVSAIIGWIFNTIEPTLRSQISYRDTAKELWDDIQQRFSLGNGVKIYQLESDISNCKQLDGETVMAYYGRIKKLWDDVNDYDALPSCNCSGCKCGFPTTLRKRRETRQTRQFLIGLEPYFATARSNILGIDPLPSLNSVYSRMIQEEEVRNLTQQRTAAMAFAVQGGSTTGTGGKQQGRPRLKCSFCTKTGHTESRCWEKHGYPEGRGPRTGAGFDGGSTSSTAKVNSVNGEPSVDANNIRLNGPYLEDEDW
ncbi:hypothetical protein RND81_06G061400 [Saponaria officinalis]|uniref:Retrotransposon gag domain-containing protein n=1 Tax=Saponaria officinalis TaxID=3572 RepID=A0AAW1K9M4_SAPOF